MTKLDDKPVFRKYKKLGTVKQLYGSAAELVREKANWFGPLLTDGEELDESDPAVKHVLHILKQNMEETRNELELDA